MQLILGKSHSIFIFFFYGVCSVMSRERKRRLNLIELAWVEGVVLRGTSWKFDPPKNLKKIESTVRGRGLWSLGEEDG